MTEGPYTTQAPSPSPSLLPRQEPHRQPPVEEELGLALAEGLEEPSHLRLQDPGFRGGRGGGGWVGGEVRVLASGLKSRASKNLGGPMLGSLYERSLYSIQFF